MRQNSKARVCFGITSTVNVYVLLMYVDKNEVCIYLTLLSELTLSFKLSWVIKLEKNAAENGNYGLVDGMLLPESVLKQILKIDVTGCFLTTAAV